MDFSFLVQQVASGENETYMRWIAVGMGFTALVSAAAYALAFGFGVVLGGLRTRPGWVGKSGDAIFELFSDIPLKVQMFFAYFVLPSLLFPIAAKTASPLAMSLASAILSLGLFMGCRISGHIAAAIGALADSQAKAAQALGFGVFQSYRLILIPQAVKNSLPALTNEFMSTVKNSSIAGTIGLAELFYQCKRLTEFTAAVYEPVLLVIAGYLAMNLLVLAFMRAAERLAFR
jgi:glutamate/aspartate transport system permease protein